MDVEGQFGGSGDTRVTLGHACAFRVLGAQFATSDTPFVVT